MSETYPVGIEIYSTSSTGLQTIGDTHQCRGRYKIIRISIGDDATITVQGSAGHDDWHTLTSESASTFYTNTDPWPYLRFNVTANTSQYGVHMGMSD